MSIIISVVMWAVIFAVCGLIISEILDWKKRG